METNSNIIVYKTKEVPVYYTNTIEITNTIEVCKDVNVPNGPVEIAVFGVFAAFLMWSLVYIINTISKK